MIDWFIVGWLSSTMKYFIHIHEEQILYSTNGGIEQTWQNWTVYINDQRTSGFTYKEIN